jgi:predicted dehydrogenase
VDLLGQPTPERTVGLALSFLAIAYVIGLGLHLQWLRDESHGAGRVFSVLFGTWAADTAAFFIGLRWGRHRLAPSISPGKTVEGAVAGWIAAVVVTASIWSIWVREGDWMGGLLVGAVVGVGAFGRNHARIYHQLAQQGEAVRLVGVVDPDVARADAVAGEFGCRAFGSVEQLVTTHSEVQAASVAVPTLRHLETARALMQAGVDVLAEKPLAASLAEADELVRLAQSLNRVGQVGHLERFNPAVRATAPLITQPMFFEVHRLSVFTPRSLDVDVILDLMIHDLDVVLWLVKSPVKEIRAVGLPILSGKADIANVRLEFESGCVANFTASRVSTERVRKLRFFQPRQYISLDYGRQEVLVFSVGEPGEGAGTPSVNPQIGVAKPAVASEEPLRAELRSFLDAVRTRSKPLVSFEDGRRALALALDIVAAMREHNQKVQLDELR